MLRVVVVFLTLSLLAAQASAAGRAETLARCSWDRPGHDPFMGELVPAVDRYTDIPAPVRARLKQRMQARQYDDLVEIRRDSIAGTHAYRSAIRDMHFGQGRMCREVSRKRWSDAMRERGLVYCESGHCLLVPTICRNLSRIERRPADVAGERLGGPEVESVAALPPLLLGEPPLSFTELAGLATLPPLAPVELLPALPPLANVNAPPILVAAFTPPPATGQPGREQTQPVVVPGVPVPPTFTTVPPTFTTVPPPVITPVPEPATWASLIAGLFVVAMAAKRRRQRG